MTLSELHTKFRLELDKLEISSVPSFLPEEIDYFLNTSIERFIKTRYSGINVHKSGFQQSQKRSDDLRTVVKTYVHNPSDFYYADNSENTYEKGDIIYVVAPDKKTIGEYYICIADTVVGLGVSNEWKRISVDGYGCYLEYPTDYWIGLGESVNITYYDSVNDEFLTKRTDVIESTIENIDSKLSNSLSEHLFHNNSAKPIRIYKDGLIYLYTDSNYAIDKYSITYIFKPSELNTYEYSAFSASKTYAIGEKVTYNNKQYICKTAVTIAAAWATVESKFEEYQITIMPDHTWDEITVNAVRYALENISENRYQTYAQESQVVE